MSVLLFLWLQSATPEGGLTGATDAFVGGNDGARAIILKHETRAVLALRKVREKASARIDPLLYEIKKTAGGEEHSEVVRTLEKKDTLEAGNQEFAATCGNQGGDRAADENRPMIKRSRPGAPGLGFRLPSRDAQTVGSAQGARRSRVSHASSPLPSTNFQAFGSHLSGTRFQ